MRKILLAMYKKGCNILSGYGFGRFYPVIVADEFLVSHLKPNFVEVQGHKMFLDSKDSLRLSISEFHEPFETELVKKEIKSGYVVLNIGANIGYYTLIFAKLVGKEGKVFAFEPDPDNFALLKKNVEINGYLNVTLVQKAISNKTGKIRLYLSERSKGDHRICNLHDGRKSIEIEAIQLDDYFKNYNGRIDFIKMDIQGAEGAAIQGMPLLLQKIKRTKMITEFWPSGLKKFGTEPEEFLKLLLKHDFKIYHLNDRKKRIEPTDISKLLETYTPKKKNFRNLLCIMEK